MTRGDPFPIELGGGAVVRRYVMDDLDALWAVASGERERLGEWMPWVESTTSIDVQRRWLTKVVDDLDGFDGCGIFVDGELAGGVGLSSDPYGITGEIGYWVREPFEGRGFVTSASLEFTRLAFEHLGLNRVVIRAGVGNQRSRAVPERLGYVEEGLERGAGRGLGGFYDIVVYAMLAEEWRDRPQ
ncbi:MAG: GNAT family N-acetyltransferase [Actinomycetota bacterium]|nr:GNAT family N-acetyltransferase [Actinomycetota bacterium]MDH5224784.1 GNAT family N-acetyltransferase [Actinomycetota bacterium]MDH5313522.1 GNAT family N-acetyltransferase [Actinomycetota bacterium]